MKLVQTDVALNAGGKTLENLIELDRTWKIIQLEPSLSFQSH